MFKFNFNPKIVVLILLVLSCHAFAEVKLPKLFSDGMVLQRDVPIKIWGWADPGEKVEFNLSGKTWHTLASSAGNWETELPSLKAGGPYTLKINELILKDILAGDVWLASGQSNMELWLRRVNDLYAGEIAEINHPEIRFFRPSTRENAVEAKSDYPDGRWLAATQENVMDFSALAWFFAEEIHRTQNLPVGIISTAIGGSPAEAWLSGNKVKPYLEKWLEEKARMDSARAEQERLSGKTSAFNWSEEINKIDPGVNLWSKENVDISDWGTISLPGTWTEKEVDLEKGSIWFAREFDVPDSLAGSPAILRLGRIIDADSAFINGTFVGTVSYQYPPRIYNIPENLLKSGKNKLVVRVFCQGGTGAFVVEKPYEIRFENYKVDLTGEWKYKTGAKLEPPKGFGTLSFRPGGLYNSLIHPMKRYPVKGVIWYQGESNTRQGFEYRELFKNLITDWRTNLNNPELPFLYVQLANLGVPNKQPVESDWAELRDAQRRALQLPNTGMAVAFDLGEWNDIHPLNKKELAQRLALEARRVAYKNENIVGSGPLYHSAEIEQKAMVIKFTSVGSGLYANNLLDGFQIAGEDKEFVWAKAVVLGNNLVKVWSTEVLQPKYVRYAWDDNPAGANLKNKEGLPASPFTTEP